MTLFSICDRGTEDEALPPEVCDMVAGVSSGSDDAGRRELGTGRVERAGQVISAGWAERTLLFLR